MTPEQILARPAKILSDAQRREYFDKGYVMLASIHSAGLDRSATEGDVFLRLRRASLSHSPTLFSTLTLATRRKSPN